MKKYNKKENISTIKNVKITDKFISIANKVMLVIPSVTLTLSLYNLDNNSSKTGYESYDDSIIVYQEGILHSPQMYNDIEGDTYLSEWSEWQLEEIVDKENKIIQEKIVIDIDEFNGQKIETVTTVGNKDVVINSQDEESSLVSLYRYKDVVPLKTK